jgi:hypothetical protein
MTCPPDFSHAAAPEELFQVITPHVVSLARLDGHPETSRDDERGAREMSVGRKI